MSGFPTWRRRIRLLERLRERAEGVRVLGVADVDLFMPALTFVFGEGILGGNAAVISTHLRHLSHMSPSETPLSHPRRFFQYLCKFFK